MKRNFWAKVMMPLLIFTMLLGDGLVVSADESAIEPKRELMVSSVGYDSVMGAYEGNAAVSKDGKWGLVKADGTVLVPFEYDACYHVDRYDGVTIFRNEIEDGDAYAYYFYDSEGNKLKEVKLGDWAELKYGNGIYSIEDCGEITYYDIYDSFIASFDYFDYEDDTEFPGASWTRLNAWGYSLVNCYAYESDYLIASYTISKDGCQKLDVQGKRPFWTNGKYVWCWDDENDKCYLFDISAKKLTAVPAADFASSFGFAGDMPTITTSDGAKSLLDSEGKVVTEKTYASISGVEGEKYYLVSAEGQFFYIDSEGRECGTDLKDAGAFYGGCAIVLNMEGQAYVIDENFEQISTGVSAESVVSLGKNVYGVKKEDSKYYLAYMENLTYSMELQKGEESVSASDFELLLAQNDAKDVVIKNADGVIFTFAQGTMTAVEGKTEYDFGTSMITDYDCLSEVSEIITKDNFVMLVDYGYSGLLPAKADITFSVGSEYAGKTLYYYLHNSDKTYELVQSVVVADDGTVTVEQEHCSAYILTNAKLTENSENISNKGDNSYYAGIVFVIVLGGAIVLLGSKKKLKVR